jgi:hypothetical protein
MRRILDYNPLPPVPPLQQSSKVIDFPAMDDKGFQQMEKRLNEQADATQAMNETLNKFIAIMGNQEEMSSPLISTPLVITPLQVLQPSRVKPGVPSYFYGDRAQGYTFLTSCELYISLTAVDFVDEQVCIYWALSYFKGRHAVSFTQCILQQELRSGRMCYGVTSQMNSCQHFAQRTRQPQHS